MCRSGCYRAEKLRWGCCHTWAIASVPLTTEECDTNAVATVISTIDAG